MLPPQSGDQLHVLSDASEAAYAGIVYLCMVDTTGCIHTSLVVAKTKGGSHQETLLPPVERFFSHNYFITVRLFLVYPPKTPLPGQTAPLYSTGWQETLAASRYSLAIGSPSSLIWLLLIAGVMWLDLTTQLIVPLMRCSHPSCCLTTCGGWTELASSGCSVLAQTSCPGAK